MEHFFAELKSAYRTLKTLFCAHGVIIETLGQYIEKPNEHQDVRHVNMLLGNLHSGPEDHSKRRIPKLSPSQSPKANMVKISK